MLHFLRVFWASPNTALGLVCGLLGLASGGQVQWRRGCFEFHGGLIKWSLNKTPIGASALTLGHTILGRDEQALDLSRDHEHIHVRQYGTWGPFFLPAYFGASLILWLRGKHAYWDNPFETQAYREASIAPPPDDAN
jgi:hypothetical protein